MFHGLEARMSDLVLHTSPPHRSHETPMSAHAFLSRDLPPYYIETQSIIGMVLIQAELSQNSPRIELCFIYNFTKYVHCFKKASIPDSYL